MIHGQCIYFRRFCLAFSLSICFSSARSDVMAPWTRRIFALYALSFSACSRDFSPAKKRLSLRSSRMAPLRSFLYNVRIFFEALRSTSGS